MSVPDPTPRTVNVTDLAVSIGRIEEGQKYVVKTVDEIKGTVAGVNEKVEGISVDLTKVTGRVDAHDVILNDMKPMKAHWSAVLAVVIASGAIVVNLLQAFLPHVK